MELTIGVLRAPLVNELEVEAVERKGLGHPDTICDALAEQLSIALSQSYLERFGHVLHHNVDKVLLLGGSTEPAFGGGRVTTPIRVFLAGRATHTYRGASIPVEELAVESSKAWFRANLHALDPDHDVEINCVVRPGSVDLVELFMRQIQKGVPLANDTSMGVGFAPSTDLEKAVSAVEAHINSTDFHRTHPEVGEDVKVMGIRRGDQMGLTIACAMIGRYLQDLPAYQRATEAVCSIATEAVRELTRHDVLVAVNTADDPEAGSVYLTVTGTSAEAGDDGQAGRGNRANGLITPYRPMTLEAAAGKNPVTHVGKLYQIAAQDMAEAAVGEISSVEAAECYLVSRIGRPVNDPQIADIRVHMKEGRPVASAAAELEQVVRVQLRRLNSLWEDIVAGKVRVY